MKWKVGDKFIVDGPDHELGEYNWEKYKGTVQTVYKIDTWIETHSIVVLLESGPFIGHTFVLQPKHMRPLTKLHKAML